MPRILTQSEFDNLSKNKTFHGEPVPPPTNPAPSPIKKANNEKPGKEFYFMHPDNSQNYKISGKFIIQVDKKMVQIPIVEGILKTTDETIKNALIKNGMIFTHEKEVTDEQ